MARKPKEIVALTLRVREGLRRNLERQAEKHGVSLNAEIETRLEDSFDLANTASLVRVLAGGGFMADLLGAIAKVFDVGGEWKKYPEKSDAAQVRIEAAYIALIIIFTKLFSTPERPLDPAAAGEVIATQRGRGALEATLSQMEGLMLANSVLNKLEHISMLEPTDSDLSERGFLKFPKRKKAKTKGKTKS